MVADFSNTDPTTSEEFRQRFFSNYYEHLAADDAKAYSAEILESRALFHYRLAQTRPKGTASVGLISEPESSVVTIVTDEMPFLVDSVSGELVRQESAIRLVVHPVLAVTRGVKTDRVLAVERLPSSGESPSVRNLGSRSVVESWIAVEIDPIRDEEHRETLLAGLRRVLAHVRVAVEDGPRMRAQMERFAATLSNTTDTGILTDIEQGKKLLRWLAAGNFIFLGYREYDLVVLDGEPVLMAKEETGLGILRITRPNWRVQHMTASGQQKAREKRLFVINKGDTRSTVYRSQYMDYIGVKTFDAQGNVSGEGQYIGLFALTAYTDSLLRIPILRDKADAVLRESGFPPGSQYRKDLLDILETYPRDELFQIEVSDLLVVALGILHLQERRRTRLFLRPDVYGRFMSAMVFLPRDRYNSGVRQRIQEELRRTFGGESVEFEVRLTESALARLFFRIWLPRGEQVSSVDALAVEHRLMTVVRSWPEGVRDVLKSMFDSEHARRLAERWADVFPVAYRVVYELEDAVSDINRFEARARALENGIVGDMAPPTLFVYLSSSRHDVVSDEDARVKLYLTGPKSLAQIIPVFQNLGVEVLDERPFDFLTTDGRRFFLYDLGLKYPEGVDPLATGSLLANAFEAVTSGLTESDSLGRLVLTTRIAWQQVGILRSYAKYARQIGIPSSYELISDTLLELPHIAQCLVRLFEVRLDPTVGAERRVELLTSIRREMKASLNSIATLDADRVLRSFNNLIESTLRTNYFQNKPYLSIKFDSPNIEGLPFPRPLYEIWVYSPRVEGVHLRFGKIARGGLRWSDRREDFRTEVLGLVKAQTVKNAVIVPTGAKGGFFAKRLPAASDRQAWLAEGQHGYRTFIRGLLDITDNRVTNFDGEVVVSPPRVVCHDSQDAYLVVAADKGTASFSDIANELSAEYGFWLGDAFASGGSVGYDHKAMGITARGAWESVKRHFRELNLDVQTQEFSVIGIGDMSGDVFGNGMLLSEHIRLLAAFDHRHIFLDPDPDPKISYAERRRLFDLPRSSWQDYNAALISVGGGVYPRQIKVIPISEAVRTVLGLDRGITQLSPPELLMAILRAPADLLYNGGIGTYVKASTESNTQVGDKYNDGIRVDGNELRVKVFVEGGNLGLTQDGRVEAALAGVLLNTDAIDNSAGVDCSDHEVNIKIFVDRMIFEGKLDASRRSGFLAGMTDEVSSLVLQNNVRQNILMANDRLNSLVDGPSHERLMKWLEVSSNLNREIEGLPSTTQLRARLDRSDRGLTAPELGVLAAHAKIDLGRALRESDLSDDRWFDAILRGYFPNPLSNRFGAELGNHPLRQEIISTILANDMINSGGITFAFRIVEETSATESAAARAFVAIREIYGLAPLLETLNGLDATFSPDQWRDVHRNIRQLLDRGVCWWINHGFTNMSIVDAVDSFRDLDLIRSRIFEFLQAPDSSRVRRRFERLLDSGIPRSAAEQWSHFAEDFALLEICRISHDIQEPTDVVASVYFAVYSRLRCNSLFERIATLSRQDRWEVLSGAALHDDLCSALKDVTRDIMRTPALRLVTNPISGAADRFHAWEETHSEPLSRVMAVLAELDRHEAGDVGSLWVALRMLRSIMQI